MKAVKNGIRRCIVLLCVGALVSGLSACTALKSFKPKSVNNPIAIKVWHYYNGFQQKSFDFLVQEFNSTVGFKQGILVEAHSYGSVEALNQKVLDAVYERVGAEEVPDGFSAYGDTVYELNSMGKVAEISQYLTEKEIAAYIDQYLEEGRFAQDDGLKIFPIAKATELLTINKTDWNIYSVATGADRADLATWEGIVSIAQDYYRWTDAKTPDVPEDGKAFFGRDAFANYIIIGCKQLGVELFKVTEGEVRINLDEDVMRRLWDNYYVPYINGYFGSYGKYRSDDLRTGEVVACVGSTSAATFFSTEVTREDGSTYPIELEVLPLPNFKGTKPLAVQQGAGMAVTKSTPEREKAMVEFLKWFTQPEQNVRFATASGYMPVTHEAKESKALIGASGMSAVLRDTLNVGMEMIDTYDLYTSTPFINGTAARSEVSGSMSVRAELDRKAVEDLISAGASRAEAVALYDTDKNFQSWLTDFRTALGKIVK